MCLGRLRWRSSSPVFPRISPGFDKGAEAQLARYKIPGGETQLLLLSYPDAPDRRTAIPGICQAAMEDSAVWADGRRRAGRATRTRR